MSHARTALPLAAARFAFAVAIAIAAVASAAPQSSAATRAELTRWFERLAASDIQVSAPQQWRYVFSASTTKPLEALTLDLVGAGYAVDTLSAGGAVAELRATRTELLTPAALERRSRELASLARKHHARYDSVDVVAGSPVR